MNAIEIDKALTHIVLEKYSECENRLRAIDKSLKTERKAIQIELGMYGLCLRAGLLYYTTGKREDTLRHFLRQGKMIFSKFPKILQAYENANNEEQLILVAALRQEAFMRDQFSDKNQEDYKKAQDLGCVEEAFELKIKTNTLNAVYKAWEEWRKKEKIYFNMFG